MGRPRFEGRLGRDSGSTKFTSRQFGLVAIPAMGLLPSQLAQDVVCLQNVEDRLLGQFPPPPHQVKYDLDATVEGYMVVWGGSHPTFDLGWLRLPLSFDLLGANCWVVAFCSLRVRVALKNKGHLGSVCLSFDWFAIRWSLRVLRFVS